MNIALGSSRLVASIVLVVAALCEVGGDALIRSGLRGRGLLCVAGGFVILGLYGVILNQLDIDFGKLLGAYVGVFALASVLCGRFLYREQVATSTWLGLGIVLLGSLVIQLGGR